MKLVINGLLYESIEDNSAEFRKITLDYIKDIGYSDSISNRGTIFVYHGTSKKNLESILKSQIFRGFPWFSLDVETAKQYSRQAGKDPVVIMLEIDPMAVSPVGGKTYLSARNKGLTLKGWTTNNNVWHSPGAKDIFN